MWIVWYTITIHVPVAEASPQGLPLWCYFLRSRCFLSCRYTWSKGTLWSHVVENKNSKLKCNSGAWKHELTDIHRIKTEHKILTKYITEIYILLGKWYCSWCWGYDIVQLQTLLDFDCKDSYQASHYRLC